MRIYELIWTNESIGKVDIYDNANAFVTTLKIKDFKNKEYADLLNKEIEKWYIASVTTKKITIGIKLK